MIKIDEYVYNVNYIPNTNKVQTDISNLILGVKEDNVISSFSTTSYRYISSNVTSSTTLTREDFPIDENNLPRQINSSGADIFFQQGSGWYDVTKEHRSLDITDTENSVLTGRTKTIKTKSAPYTYGEKLEVS